MSRPDDCEVSELISICSLYELIEQSMPPKITQNEFPTIRSLQPRESPSPMQQIEAVAETECANEAEACNVHDRSQLTTSVSSENLSPPSSLPILKPYPYFFYQDFSTVPDPDPLIPLTGPGCMPRFLAKMHSILSRDDLSHIVSWMPHGRSWKVLKPEEFEKTVIPTYVSGPPCSQHRVPCSSKPYHCHLCLVLLVSFSMPSSPRSCVRRMGGAFVASPMVSIGTPTIMTCFFVVSHIYVR